MSEVTANYEVSTIAEIPNGIILASYEKVDKVRYQYQSETELEIEFIENLMSQGYERFSGHTMDDLYRNLRFQMERLNQISFSDDEWDRFLKEYLDAPSDGLVEKTRKIQENHLYDFKFDNGELKNIKIIDKQNIHKNVLQVANQITQRGKHKNRYDVTILVNGLPLVHVELKKRGIPLTEAFEQIHRYSKESFNIESSLYKFVQIFVISNGTYTRYFANTTAQDKNNYEFTCEWADAKNKVIRDIVDFTKTFFQKNVVLEILTKYCVFDSNNILLIMRPYQIAATERILWKIKSSFENKKYGTVNAGGFVWHTTGSGKTLTSFKAARLATELPYIDKVFFVVDRKDLDYQTMKEYKKFQQDSVNGSKDTKELKRSIEKNDNKIIVTTIQKLNEFVKKNPNHPIYEKQCVLIFDECHRSQFGEAQKNIKRNFKKYYQFGFTGTPIFEKNALDGQLTVNVFGAQLHSYVITDAIRDGKVLKFKVDYNNISPKFKGAETEVDEKKLEKIEKKMLLHPERISEITTYILDTFNRKTHRNEHFYNIKDRRFNGFNAMFAVQSVDAAKMYYDEFKRQQQNIPEKDRLVVGTIFSFAQNEEQSAIGEIRDESLEVNALDSSAKEFLDMVIDEYNQRFKTNYSTDGKEFENYYKNLSLRVKEKEVDLLIVVGMFLTGFDAPKLNTLYVDKNLKYHGLIQAYSRTNRILNKVKAFGNIVCFRDLENATKEAISLFGDKNSINVILEKSFKEYINGFKDDNGKFVRGYIEICKEIKEKFPDPTEIEGEANEKEFVTIFGEFLKAENILRNFDEFESFEKIFTELEMQDMRSVYVDIREKIVKEIGRSNELGDTKIDFSDVEFQIDLLKTDEINLDYILALILEKSKKNETVENIKTEVSRAIRSSVDTRSKEDLIMEFISKTDLTKLKERDEILESFYYFARSKKAEKIEEVVLSENLKGDAKLFIEKSISKGFVDTSGMELNNILPPTSRRQGARERKKQEVLVKLQDIVEVFVGI